MFGDIIDLPAACPNDERPFGIDRHINTATIDKFLDLEGVAYIDLRLLFDTARFDLMGGQQNLLQTIDGFKIVPWPYIGTVGKLPVEGAYEGETLFTIEWSDDDQVVSARPNFEESRAWLERLFPCDEKIFLVCGAGGYSGQARKFLIHLGWNDDDVYNVGSMWKYRGRCGVPVVDREGDDATADLTGVDYELVDFGALHRILESADSPDPSYASRVFDAYDWVRSVSDGGTGAFDGMSDAEIKEQRLRERGLL